MTLSEARLSFLSHAILKAVTEAKRKVDVVPKAGWRKSMEPRAFRRRQTTERTAVNGTKPLPSHGFMDM